MTSNAIFAKVSALGQAPNCRVAIFISSFVPLTKAAHHTSDGAIAFHSYVQAMETLSPIIACIPQDAWLNLIQFWVASSLVDGRS